jgi:hypothetical protein
MKIISIEAISHKKQDYPTVGNWKFQKKRLVILISRMKNPDYIFLVALHELCEAWLCFRRGISEKSVTKFDIAFEKVRKPGDASEPGDSPRAPYYFEHQVATRIEKIMAKELAVDWADYEDTIAIL